MATRSADLPGMFAGVERPLVWSEYLLLAALALALMGAALPADWFRPAGGPMRHAALLLTLPALVLGVAASRIDAPLAPRRAHAAVGSVAWPLVALALAIVAGSLYARIANETRETFLNLGAYMLLTPIVARVVVASAAPERLAAAFMKLLVATALLMCGPLVASHGVTQVYHEQIFLVLPAGVYAWFALRSRALAWLAFAGFLSMAWFSAKNTSYIIAVLMVLYVAAADWMPRLRRRAFAHRAFGRYLAMLGVAALALAIAFLVMHRERFLPSGNVEYRLFTYEAAWEAFRVSPFWGSAFTAPTVSEFPLYEIGIAGNRLPTHSDLMDLIAHGGALAALAWLASLLRIGGRVRAALAPRAGTGSTHDAALHGLTAMSLAAVVVYAFNPILLQPPLAWLVWAPLGVLLGAALHRAGAARP